VRKRCGSASAVVDQQSRCDRELGGCAVGPPEVAGDEQIGGRLALRKLPVLV
jgi:hypothetical protein